MNELRKLKRTWWIVFIVSPIVFIGVMYTMFLLIGYSKILAFICFITGILYLLYSAHVLNLHAKAILTLQKND